MIRCRGKVESLWVVTTLLADALYIWSPLASFLGPWHDASLLPQMAFKQSVEPDGRTGFIDPSALGCCRPHLLLFDPEKREEGQGRPDNGVAATGP